MTGKLAAFLVAALLLTGLRAHAAADVADAVMRRDEAALEALLEARADVDAAQPDGATALHWAAYYDDLPTVQRLLAAGADPRKAAREGMTPLALATQAGNAAMVHALLDAGADVDEKLPNGETPLMMAARTGRTDALEALLERGADVDAAETLRGTTALMWAAAYSNPEAVRVLLEHGAATDARSAAAARGRRPYLAPPARERIDEFLQGTGLRGAVVEFDLDEDEPEFTFSGGVTAAARGATAAPTDEEIAAAEGVVEDDGEGGFTARPQARDGGGLTPLHFAAREGDLRSVQLLLDAGADVNATSEYGWTALLAATHNKYYELGKYLLERGADPNIANKGGWTPLYIATDNRNIEGGDYPTRRADMDHLEFIRLLLERGADPNLRMQSSTETRTVFTQQWLFEEGATPFLRAAQSGDVVLMRLLLEHGADPSIPTIHNVTPLMVAAGIGWVEGVTYEWSPEQTYEAVKLILELGADVNEHDTLDGRVALMGAAHKGRTDVIELLVEHGADLDARDIGSRDSIHTLAGVTWRAIDYADGLVRVGVQSATPQPEAAALLRRLMRERGLSVPPEGRTLESICVTDICK
jgi:ankyrin repeat protein